MEIRGMKQVLHGIFLIVGIFSLIMLGITVDTYLGYAEEGYGLEMNFDSATLNYDHWLVLKFYFENPGGLDISLMGGNLTLNEVYNISSTGLPNDDSQEYPEMLPAHETVSVMIWIPITNSADLDDIRAYGQADIDLDLLLFVPERYMNTHITYQGIVEVSI